MTGSGGGRSCDRQVGLSVPCGGWDVDVNTIAGSTAGDSFIAGVVDGVGGRKGTSVPTYLHRCLLRMSQP